MNEFVDAKRRLNDFNNKVKQYEKKLGKKCDWDNPEDVALYKHTLRFSKRVELLDKYVPKRICPICQSHRVSPRSWVMNEFLKLFICRSCFYGDKIAKTNNPIINRTLFSNVQYRYDINHFDLKAAREEAGINEYKFAERMGWSRNYQRKIESGQVKSVDLITAESILGVFREFGRVLLDCL